MRRIAFAAPTLLFAVAAPCQTFFPPPPTPSQNLMTTEKAMLGMALFWEEQMSVNNQVACGTCHEFQNGGEDPRPGTHPGYDGVFGTADDVHGSKGVPVRDAAGRLVGSEYGLDAQVTPRKAPSVINIAYQNRLFYDGRARDGDFRDPISNQVTATGATALEHLILEPPVNPIEMGMPSWQAIVDKLAGVRPLVLAAQVPARLQTFVGTQTYPQLFQRAFGTPEITPTRVAFAIATYVRTLVSDQSRFDFILAGSGSLTPAESRGRQVFEQAMSGPQGTAAACVQCHGDVSAVSHTRGPSFQSTTYYTSNTGNFHNVGIRPIVEDPGAGGFTGVQTDMGRFKVPMLRNVELHGEYGHGGQFATLADTIEFYDRGGDFHVNQAIEIKPRNMTAQQKADLEAFLLALTDPRVASGIEPFDSPVLGSSVGAHRPAPIGTASPGTNNVLPTMVANDPTLVGSSQFALGVEDVRPNSLTALLWSLEPAPAGGTNLAGTTFHVGLNSAELVVTGMSQTAPSGQGVASTAFAIPDNAALSGVVAYTQWLVLDPGAASGVAASAAIQVTLH